MRPHIQLLGLPRTCTNVAEILLLRNVPDLVLLVNWPPPGKHHATPATAEVHGVRDGQEIETDDLRFIVCTKEPLSWLWSLWSHTSEFYQSRREFLTSTAWHYAEDIEGMDASLWSGDRSPCAVYNLLMDYWLHRLPGRTGLLAAEDLLTGESQLRAISRVGEAIGITTKASEVATTTIRPGAKITDEPFNPRSVEFTSDEVALIRDRIDWRIAEEAGYAIAR